MRVIELDRLIGQQQEEDENGMDMDRALERLSNSLRIASGEQANLYNFYTDCASVRDPFVVFGAAGTGKSFLLQMLRDTAVINDFFPVVLAPTGVAAYNVYGQTFHSFFGIDLETGQANLNRLADFLVLHPQVAFFVDECSMLGSQLVSVMSDALSVVCASDEPFAGLPVVYFGDMGQLPPISLDKHLFFMNPLVQEAFMVCLRQPMRQMSGEDVFLRFLNDVWLYTINDNVINFIRSRLVLPYQVPWDALMLYTEKEPVRQFNKTRLRMMPGALFVFSAEDVGDVNALDREVELDRTLLLKINAPCILLANLDVLGGWVNGTICKVIRIDEAGSVIFVQKDGGYIRTIRWITRVVYRTGHLRMLKTK